MDGTGTGPTPLVSSLAAQDLSNYWECSPPSQVRPALRAMIVCESCTTQDDGISAPAPAEEIGQCDKKVRSVGEGPDTGEPPPTGISATAQELVQRTHVNLGHLSQPQFPRIYRAAGAPFEVSLTADISFSAQFAHQCLGPRVTDEPQFLSRTNSRASWRSTSSFWIAKDRRCRL